jgi:trehalose 6-phosphate synthase
VSQLEHWLSIARSSPLGLLTDLDGTLIGFAATPEEARPGPEVLAILQELVSADGVTVVVVSGRPRETLDRYFADCPGLLLVAEHGGWRRDRGAWHPAIDAAEGAVESLSRVLAAIAETYPGALVERKTWSVAFHFRNIMPVERNAAVVEVDSIIASWLATHPGFSLLRGSMVLEVRPARMVKGRAVPWLRDRIGSAARLVALGDDVTDEDTFTQLGPQDESILVAHDTGRASAARWRLDGTSEALELLAWIASVRRGEAIEPPPTTLPRRLTSVARPAVHEEARFQLLVISNRLPELRSSADFDAGPKKRNVGGLVSALEPALSSRRGIWLGWSGRTVPGSDGSQYQLDERERPALAAVDLPEAWYDRYYNGMCNAALWPLLHSFPSRVAFSDDAWDSYREANEAFAAAAVKLVQRDQPVWVHDYHLLLLAERMRERGHRGPLGLFMHTPFPGPDIWFILPWADDILTALLSFDLIGFHTPSYAAAFRQCLAAMPGVMVGDDSVEYGGRRTRVGAFPLGIVPESFQEAPESSALEEIAALERALGPSRLVLGVDRLDYTKGIPERLEAFARLLERWPEWRRRVSLVQISVPSRGDVAEYAEQRERVERIVGRTNGDHGDHDWVPIRYLYRSFGRAQLSLLYRAAAVGYVTPLRDGMNLVAKEFVAAQDPEDPGVLLLSRFAGAAHELADGALLTNPWHVDALAADLDRALRMDPGERRSRHRRLAATVARSTALTWAEDFLSALSAS